MSRKVGTLLALTAVVAVAVGGYEVAKRFGGETVAAEGSSVPGSYIAGPSGATSASSASSAPASPSAATSTPPTASSDDQSGQTPATNSPVQITGSTVPVAVTFYGWNAAAHEVEVGGYVAGVIESNGTCTLTLTRAGGAVTGQRQAAPDATTTTCGEIDVPGSRLSTGTWTAVLSYRSARHTGAAAPVQIRVTL